MNGSLLGNEQQYLNMPQMPAEQGAAGGNNDAKLNAMMMALAMGMSAMPPKKPNAPLVPTRTGMQGQVQYSSPFQGGMGPQFHPLLASLLGRR